MAARPAAVKIGLSLALAFYGALVLVSGLTPACERTALGLWLRPGPGQVELADVALAPDAQAPSARE